VSLSMFADIASVWWHVQFCQMSLVTCYIIIECAVEQKCHLSVSCQKLKLNFIIIYSSSYYS